MKTTLEIKLELLSIIETGIKSIFNKKTAISQDTLKHMTENYTNTLAGAAELINAKVSFKSRLNTQKLNDFFLSFN